MAGIVSGISHLAVGQCDARRQQAQSQSNANPTKTPTPTPTPTEDKHVLITYCNAGKQNIEDLAVDPCDARRQQTQTQTQTQSNANPTKTPTPTPSQDKHLELETYCNAGKQNIKGLTNQTGYVKGNANGVINFGDLTASASDQREA